MLTNTRGGLLDGDAHKAMDMVSWEEDGREKRSGVEVEVEKLFAERGRAVLRERGVRVTCGYTQGREKEKEKSKTSSQNILACLGVVRVSLSFDHRPELMT